MFEKKWRNDTLIAAVLTVGKFGAAMAAESTLTIAY